MEYISLDNQQNTYPSVKSYKKTSETTFVLNGNYEVNKFNFKLPNLDSIKIIANTTFRFLLGIRKNANSELIGLYTSPLYYNELVTSYNESNPYFINSSFQPEFILNYYLDDISSLKSELTDIQTQNSIEVDKNIFILKDGSYDYISLIKYIDWVVSPVKLSDLGNNSVLPLNEISSYTLPTVKAADVVTTPINTNPTPTIPTYTPPSSGGGGGGGYSAGYYGGGYNGYNGSVGNNPQNNVRYYQR